MSEHLEPEPGAILMFKNGPGSMKYIDGERYQLEGTIYKFHALFYCLRLVADPRFCLEVDQDIMDRCGRLLVSGEEEME